MAAFSTNLSVPASETLPLHASIPHRIAGAIQARRLRHQTITTYRELLCAEDHILKDLGVTRDDVCKLLDELAPRR